MLLVTLFTFLSLFPSAHCSNYSSTSPAIPSAVLALIIILVLIVLVSPFAYFTVHCLRLEIDRTHRKLRYSKAAVESLTHNSILRAAQVASLQNQTRQLLNRCSELEPQAQAAESLAADNKILETKLALSIATIDELKSDITTMAAQQARIVDDARNFKNMFDEANQQKLIFERRAQVAAEDARDMTKTAGDALDKVYELDCRLEEKDAELYDARQQARKVNGLQECIEELEEANKSLCHLVCEYQDTISEKDRIVQELEEETQAIKLEKTVSSSINTSDCSVIEFEEALTRNDAIFASPAHFTTNTTNNIAPAAQPELALGSTYCLPIHAMFSSSDTTIQAFTQAFQSYNSAIDAPASFSPTSPIPPLVRFNTNESDCDSDSNTTAINSLTTSLSDTDNSHIGDVYDLKSQPIFISFPSRCSSLLITNPTSITSTFTPVEHTLLRVQTPTRNESDRADIAYWKTIWAMKFAGIRGEARCKC